MKILAIETSCDETAVAILECEGGEKSATFKILGNALLSQVEIHKEYGGVFPMLAKREHAKNLVPLLESALEEAELLHEDTQAMTEETRTKISEILVREQGLAELFFEFVNECEKPSIDAIAVTAGPGLEPALWVGVNFAKALSLALSASRRIPLVAVNHMEGHIMAALAVKASNNKLQISNVELPVLALLISGGHTELVLMREWLKYELIGQTRDDAVGEAFDKVARMLGLPYPGGPEISRIAEKARTVDSQTAGFESANLPFWPQLPRPMIHEASCDFSFAGLKTAVLYLLRDNKNLNDAEKSHVAREFEDAVTDVLWKKTSRAIEKTGAKTLVIGGGVSANTHIRRIFTENIAREYSHISLRIPAASLTTDNAIMIALAGFYHAQNKEFADLETLKASGNLRLA